MTKRRQPSMGKRATRSGLKNLANNPKLAHFAKRTMSKRERQSSKRESRSWNIL